MSEEKKQGRALGAISEFSFSSIPVSGTVTYATPCARCHAMMNHVGYEQDEKHNQHCKDCARILFEEKDK